MADNELMTDGELYIALNCLADMKKKYSESKAQWEEMTSDLKKLIESMEEDIAETVLSKGESFGTERITAIWNKGKATWDGKLLEGYALAHPDILQARKVGKPSVSFRMMK